jgi:hypothetical protein
MDKAIIYGGLAIGLVGVGAYAFTQWTKKREADAEVAATENKSITTTFNPNLNADLEIASLADENFIHNTCKDEANRKVKKKYKAKVKNAFDRAWWNTFNREDHWYDKYYEQCLDAYDGGDV